MRHTIKIAAAALLGAAGLAHAQTTFYLTVLHNNDGESQIINAGAGALQDFGGIARFKTVVDNLRAQALTYPAGPEEKGSILISSGDNFLAGPEFDASLSRPGNLPYFDSIGIGLIGYDAMIIGNHEFDFGPDVFQRFVEGTPGTLPFLSANLDFAGEPGLSPLVGTRLFRSVVATIPTTTGTEQVGVIGATTEALPFISSPRGVTVSSVAAAVNAEVAALQSQGITKIILASHLQGLTSERDLIPLLDGVDIVIGGGGGELIADADDVLVPGDTRNTQNIGGLDYPRVVNDSNGTPVPLVTTRGDYRYVGRLVIGFNAAGEVTTFNDPIDGPVRVSGIGVDAVTPNPLVQAQVVDPVAAHVLQLQQTVIGQREVPLDGVTNNVRAVETNLGNLCADSLLYSVNTRAAQFGVPTADVALQNGGGIRNDSVLPVGNFTEFDTFSILPFSNLVAVVPNVSAQRFKEILENCVANVAGTPGGGSSTGRFAQISGFRMVWAETAQRQTLSTTTNPITGVTTATVTQVGQRVREVILNDGRVIVRNGQVVPGAPSVNIATIDFNARGGDQYPFNGLPFTVVGQSYQQALDTFIQDWLQGGVTARRYPVGGERRIIRTASPIQNFSFADHNLSGSVTVDDVFAFLTDYFAQVGDGGSADFDRSGLVSVQDIFAFLSAWFADRA